MPNKLLKIERESENGHWKMLSLHIILDNKSIPISSTACIFQEHYNENEDENLFEIAIVLAEEKFDFDLIEKVFRCFVELRVNDLSGNSRESNEFLVELEPHFSCKINKNNNKGARLFSLFKCFTSKENKISQSKIKRKLAKVGKNSEVMKFFEENQCSVCLSSYKEIVESNLHIVVPPCGHPLCCGCADKVLVSIQEQCPRCKGNVTAKSWELMKFNGDLELNSEDQRVFL